MRIVFTQFTPPFEHGKSEQEYLAYDDWFAKLRRHFAREHEVAFVSLTREKQRLEIPWDGYRALFFPVDNPQDRQRDGRMRYLSREALNWLAGFAPEIIHVVGTGSDLGARFLEQAQGAHTFLWERCTVTDKVLTSQEVALTGCYLHPTQLSLQRAQGCAPGGKLLRVPLGADTERFRPLEVEKAFDLVSVGRLTPAKQISRVQALALKHDLSWIHAGGWVKGAPYGRWGDLWHSRKMRKIGLARGPKRSRSGRHESGMYDHASMPEVFNRAHLMVHPSLGEGAARAVQEALACGVPVIALREAVPWIEPEFGIALEDPAGLEEAVLSILADREKARRMGLAGRAWLAENHGFSRLAEVIEALHLQGAHSRFPCRCPI